MTDIDPRKLHAGTSEGEEIREAERRAERRDAHETLTGYDVAAYEARAQMIDEDGGEQATLDGF